VKAARKAKSRFLKSAENGISPRPKKGRSKEIRLPKVHDEEAIGGVFA